MKLGYLFLFCGVVAGAIHPPVVSNFNCSKKWKYDSTLVTLSNKGVNDVFTSLWDIVRHTADNSATIETDFHEDKGPMTFVARKIELLEVDLHSDPETKLIDDDSKILVSIKNMKMKVKVYLLMSLHFGIVDTDNTDVVITAWIDNGSLKLIFHNYHRENGTPIIELSKITMKAEGFDFDVEGNIIIRAMGKVMKLFKNKLKKMIETKSKEEFRKFYDIVISNKLPSLQTNMTFGNNFKMNYGMTSDAFIMKNKLFIPINGNIYKNEHALTKFDGALDGCKAEEVVKDIQNHGKSFCFHYPSQMLWRNIVLVSKISGTKFHLMEESVFGENVITAKAKANSTILPVQINLIPDSRMKNITIQISDPSQQTTISFPIPSSDAIRFTKPEVFYSEAITSICCDATFHLDRL